MTIDGETDAAGAGPRRGSTLVLSLLAALALLLGCTTGAVQEQDAATGPAETAQGGTGPAGTGPAETAGPGAPATESATDRERPTVSERDPRTESRSEPSEPEPAAPILGEGVAPAHLRVSSIGVDEDLIDLGLQPDGTMEVPSDWDRVGWFTGGGRPGGRGPTVLAGHVDSPTAAAVFYRLTELAAGDVVEVTDVEGTLHTYEVYRVVDIPKDNYPTHEVFGAVNADELRLITCTGEFDQAQGRHADNRVVFAAAVDR